MNSFARVVLIVLGHLLAASSLLADDLIIVPPDELARYWVVDGTVLEYLELDGRRLPTFACMLVPFVIETDGRLTTFEHPLLFKRADSTGATHVSPSILATVANRALPKFVPGEHRPAQAIYTARPVVILNKTIHRRLEETEVAELVSLLNEECAAIDLERLQAESQSERSVEMLRADPRAYLRLGRNGRDGD